jgi:hypothetical protein
MADDGGKRSEALRWYDTHLAEGGAFAPEALGRKMLALHAAGETTLARSVATEYLARFPAGPYARQAKDLAER